MNLLTLALIAIVLFGLPTLYFAWRSREFRKFLAGAFFVSAGIQFYLYLAKVSVPLLGTDLVVALYLNRRLWPFTALNSWTGGLSIGLNSWKHCT